MLNFTSGFTCLGVDFASFGPLGPPRDRLVRSLPAPLPAYQDSDVDPAVVMSFGTDFELDIPERRPSRPLVS